MLKIITVLMVSWLLLFFGGWGVVALGYAATFLDFPHLNPTVWQPESRMFLYAWGFVCFIFIIGAGSKD